MHQDFQYEYDIDWAELSSYIVPVVLQVHKSTSSPNLNMLDYNMICITISWRLVSRQR